MHGTEHSQLGDLPEEMFTLIKSASASLSPRLGRLTLPGRHVIETPHYLGLASRGVVPHLSQDNFERHTAINGIYAALEDFIERAPARTPPVHTFRPSDGSSPLKRFTALPDETLLVLGARRAPPVAAPAANSNTNATVAVSTALGFRSLKAEDYAQDVEGLGADVVVALGDVPYGRALGSKRVEKATDRTTEWLREHVVVRRKNIGQVGSGGQGKLFATLLPVSCASQQYHVDALANELREDIDGLVIHSLDTLSDLPDSLGSLPRLGLGLPDACTPLDVLRHVSLGIDVLTIPFIGAATDAGIALDFAFPAPIDSTIPRPLGVDMWSPDHAADLSPLRPDCTCYACTKHHRAYLQHLLNAKEMLGWVLLQIHNHHVLDLFFASIRSSIAAGTFEADVEAFTAAYEPQLPAKTGQGPRVRGYQFKSEGPGEPKKNAKVFQVYDQSGESLAETPAAPSPAASADALESRGFAEPQR